MRPPQSVTSGWRSTGRWYHQGTRACAHASRYPQGMLKHAGQQMPDKVARVAAAAAAVERGTDRMAASVPERWPNRQHELQLSACLGAKVGDRERCLVSLSRPGLAWHLVIGGNNTYGLVCMFVRYAWPDTFKACNAHSFTHQRYLESKILRLFHVHGNLQNLYKA
jgi:hypothetical protein